MTEQLHFHFSLSCSGEGNGIPLQCSCLENPRDGGAWWAAVYGVAQSRTRLKQLSSSSSANSWLAGKDPDLRKVWRQKEKRETEDEMVGWRHWFNGHELGTTLGDSEGQGSLECCSPWGCEESDTTWWLNNTSCYCTLLYFFIFYFFCRCSNFKKVKMMVSIF